MRKFKKIFAHLFVDLLAITSCAFIGRSCFITSSGDKQEQYVTLDSNCGKVVCYINSTKHKFTTIEKALEVAKANSDADDIYVIPRKSGAPNVINITRDCEVAKDNHLFFSFSEDGTNKDWGQDRKYEIGRTFFDVNENDVNKYRTCLINVMSDVKITINGSLTVDGKCGVGVSNQRPVSHTCGNYVELLMHENALIEIVTVRPI